MQMVTAATLINARTAAVSTQIDPFHVAAMTAGKTAVSGWTSRTVFPTHSSTTQIGRYAWESSHQPHPSEGSSMPTAIATNSSKKSSAEQVQKPPTQLARGFGASGPHGDVLSL